MPRGRGKRRREGGLKDATKQMLVISFLLDRENLPSSASTIWSAWNPKNPAAVGTVSSQSGRALSLSGTIKICDRLVSEGILVSIKQKGYNLRDLVFYRFPSKGDQSYPEGFLRVAERTKGAPFILMDSAYGRTGIREVLTVKIENDLGVDLGPWREVMIWAAGRSPTAFMMMCDRDLSPGDPEVAAERIARLRRFLRAVGGAVSVDRASSYRGRLLSKDKRTSEAEELIEAGAASAGDEEKALLERLNGFEEG